MTMELRVQSATASLDAQVADLQEDTTICTREATMVFGKDDWKDYKSMKEVVAEMKDNGAALTQLMATWRSEVTALVTECSECGSAMQYKEGLLKLTELRTGLGKEVSARKKKVGAVKAAMKSVEKALWQGMTADADSAASTAPAAGQAQTVAQVEHQQKQRQHSSSAA